MELELSEIFNEEAGELVSVEDTDWKKTRITAVRSHTDWFSRRSSGVKLKDRATVFYFAAADLDDETPAETWKITTEKSETFEVMSGPDGHLWEWVDKKTQTYLKVYAKQR